MNKHTPVAGTDLGKIKQIALRLPATLFDELANEAAQQQRSMAGHLRFLIMEGMIAVKYGEKSK